MRIINPETNITRNGRPWPGKGIHYRMHPANIGCLTAARVDCWGLANNHVLDWGYERLAETLRALDREGIAQAGAGRSRAEAHAPAILNVAGKGRVLVYSFGPVTSGIPSTWSASGDRPGVQLLEDLSEETARRLASEMRQAQQPGEVTVASVHWGPNWG